MASPPPPSHPHVTPESWALAQAIRHFRGERTQREVAEAAGLDATTWSFYETGRRRPKARNLQRVLHGLGCTRLELEETAWRFRRERLLEEQDAARRAGDPRFVGSAVQVARELRERGEGEAGEAGDPLRRGLRELLAHVAVILEEVIVRVVREGGEGSETGEGAADREGPGDLDAAR
jgi:transcriptional regulator with XRE-family HTH domain